MTLPILRTHTLSAASFFAFTLSLLCGSTKPAVGQNVRIHVDQDLATRVVNEISWPLTIKSGGQGDAIDTGPEPGMGGNESPLYSAGMEKAFVALLVRAQHGTPRWPSDEVRDAFMAILGRASGPGQDAVRDALGRATEAEIGALLKVVEVSWTPDWTVVDIRKPAVNLHQPVRIPNLDTQITAKGVGCVKVKILGTFCTGHVTLGPFHVVGQMRLELGTDKTRIVGTPVGERLDLIVTVKIVVVKVNIPIPVTKIVNKLLKNRPPVSLLDLSSLQRDIPRSSSRLAIESMAISDAASGIDLDIQLVTNPRLKAQAKPPAKGN